MRYYFGFKPSAVLTTKITELRAAVSAKQTNLYVQRDAVMLQITEELVNYLLTEIINTFPDGDDKTTMLKVADFVQSTINKLLNQVLGKDSDADAMTTIDFLEQKTFITDSAGDERIGFEMTEALYTGTKNVFTGAVAAGDVDIATLKAVFDDLTDAIMQHFLTDMTGTLKLGFVKSKLLPVADSAIRKGIKVGTKKIFPELEVEEKVDLCQLYLPLMFDKAV